MSYEGVKSAMLHVSSKLADAGSFIANDVEPLEKVAKVSYRIIDLSQLLFKWTSVGFKTLSGRLKESSELFESVHVFDRYRELFLPDANGNNFFKVNTWQKIADRVLLTFHSTMKTTGYLMAVGLVTLGKIATVSVGHLAIFKLVTEAFVLGSSFFGIWDTQSKFKAASNKKAMAALKIQKWNLRDDFIAKVREGNKEEIERLDAKYKTKTFKLDQTIEASEKKLAKAKAYAELLESPESVDLPENLKAKLENTTAEQLLSKYRVQEKSSLESAQRAKRKQLDYFSRMEHIKTENFQALGDRLSKINVDYKLRKYEVITENAKIDTTKAYLAVAKGVAKIAVVSLALVLIALNQWALPFAATLLAMGIISDGLGLTKILYDHYVKPLPLPVAPAA